MKKMLLIAAAVMAMNAGSAVAAEIKPYVGVGVGFFEIDPGQNKQSTFGGHLFVGAEFHEYFAAELRVGSTGQHEREEVGPLTETFQVNWFVSALAKPKVEVFDGFDAYGLVGITSMSSSITPLNSVIEQTSTNTALTFGLGAQYHYNNQLSAGIEWVRYSTNADAATKNTAAFDGLDVNGFTLSVAYTF